jgi:integrase
MAQKREGRPGVVITRLDDRKIAIPRGSTIRATWWRVTLGRKVTGGKKLRRWFRMEREAADFVEDTLNRRQVEGTQAFDITPGLRMEAVNCQRSLVEAGERMGRLITLTEAVEFYLKHALPAGGVVKFEDARERFMESRKAANLKPRYLRNLDSQFTQLSEEFSERRINLITTADLEDWLSDREQSPKTRNNYVVTLRTFFGYCLEQKWCAENPALALGKSKVEDAPAGILTTDEARRVLSSIKEHSPQMLPTALIQLFAGLRRSEACALEWREVKASVIEVAALKAKTRSRRVVDIQPNLAAWLDPLRQKSGKVCPVGEDAYGEHLRQAIERANEQGKTANPPLPALTWKHNCLRHTCASMHLARFSNEAKTALQMGHAIDVLHRHYKGLVTKAESEEFWAIFP